MKYDRGEGKARQGDFYFLLFFSSLFYSLDMEVIANHVTSHHIVREHLSLLCTH